MQIIEFLDEPVDSLVPGVPLANGHVVNPKEFAEFEPEVSQKILKWILTEEDIQVPAGMSTVAIVSTKHPSATNWHYGEGIYVDVDGTKRVLHSNHFNIWLCDNNCLVFRLARVFHFEVPLNTRVRDNIQLDEKIEARILESIEQEQVRVADKIEEELQTLKHLQARHLLLLRVKTDLIFL